MKLTTAIKAAQNGFDKLDAAVATMEQDVKERGKELTRLRDERSAHGAMLDAMWKLQAAQKPGETVEFNYSESSETQRDLIRVLCGCYTSERREIGKTLGLETKDSDDIQFVRTIVEAAKNQDRFDEVVTLANSYVAKHRD